MRVPSRRNFVVLFLLLCGFACSGDRQARIARVENGLMSPVRIKGDKGWNILDRMKFYNVPGVSIAVFDSGGFIWSKGYGVADLETGEPVTDKTLFIAGSVSKPVAVMGALRLVQEGRLSLDGDINAYLVSWKVLENEFTKSEKVTLRRIMSHSAGLTVHGFLGYVAGRPVPTLVQILDGEPPANSAPVRVDTVPGTLWRYSGGGTMIMQQALIDVENKPFAAIMKEKVLGPLGLTSSSYEQDMGPERLRLAASGHSKGKVIEGKRYMQPELAAAGLWTTPADLARFAIEVERSAAGKSNKVLTQETARLMITPQINIIPTQDMALGLFLEKRGRSAYFGHGGADVGFVCQLTANREAGYGAAVMTNSDSMASPLINEILQSIAVEYNWQDYAAPPVELISLAATQLEPYAGRYLVGSDNVLTVELKNQALEGKTTETPAFSLLPIAENEFVRRDDEIRYVFAKATGGAATELTLRSPRREVKALRLSDDVKVPFERLLAGEIDAAFRAYQELYRRDPKDPAVDENRLNGLGYRLMADKKYREAIAVLKLNVELYPGSWNAYDSLGEAYMLNGDKALAISHYEKSLELNPQNNNGAQMLKKLRNQ